MRTVIEFPHELAMILHHGKIEKGKHQSEEAKQRIICSWLMVDCVTENTTSLPGEGVVNKEGTQCGSRVGVANLQDVVQRHT